VNNGLTKDEIKEVLLQTAILCGRARRVVAFRLRQGSIQRPQGYENGSLHRLGSMGQPMAANLAKEGFAVRSFDLNGTGSSSSVQERPRARSS